MTSVDDKSTIGLQESKVETNEKMSKCPLVPGSLILQRPLHHFLWCWRNNQWPSFFSLIYLLIVCLISIPMSVVLGFSGITHVMQYIGSDEFVHTSFGQVRLITYTNLTTGLLDTSIILLPRANEWSNQAAVEYRRLQNCKTPVNLMDFLRTPLVRLGFLSTRARKANVVRNCVDLIVLVWSKTLNVDFHRSLGVADGGLYPEDFLTSGHFIKSLTTLVVPVTLDPKFVTRLQEWITTNVGFVKEEMMIRLPTVQVFGPFPPQYYPVVEQAFLAERNLANETNTPISVEVGNKLHVCGRTNHIYFSARNSTLEKLGSTLDQMVPHTAKIPLNRSFRKFINVCRLDPTVARGLVLDNHNSTLFYD